jgi:hypothetical protein
MILPKYLTKEHMGELKVIFNSTPFDLLRVDYNRMPLELDEEGQPQLIKRQLEVKVVNNALETNFITETIKEYNYSKYGYNPDDMYVFIGIRCVMGIPKEQEFFKEDASFDHNGVKLESKALGDIMMFSQNPRIIELETLEKEHKDKIKNFYKYFYKTKKFLQEHGRI